MSAYHSFHIPVMGLAFTIDTPIRVARFGIDSVLSIVEDDLIEGVRKFHSHNHLLPYQEIKKSDPDARARRITEYLNLIDLLLQKQGQELRDGHPEADNAFSRYFKLLPESSPLKARYDRFLDLPEGDEKTALLNELRNAITIGEVQVNIMTKVDRTHYTDDGLPLGPEETDASAALRGFALAKGGDAVVMSAGLNPRLYGYIEQFPVFFPTEEGTLRKRLILKVSDFRSAQIQGRYLAKRGLWISEFRIESGLNCGGHAFATDGLLIGPILAEFKEKRAALQAELFDICQTALAKKNLPQFQSCPLLRITYQGGIGTATEDKFLRDYYELDSTGWGSPFLLVPEATSVDEDTLQKLTRATPDDYILSNASPLGVRFYNFTQSSSRAEQDEKIEAGRPGSPCYNKHLTFNTEFSERPICTASREYQSKKIAELTQMNMPDDERRIAIDAVTEKECLCQGLSASFFLKHKLPVPHKLTAVTLCPGPNLAYFSRIATLEEMVGHIYGRVNLLNRITRPHLFINELRLYVDYIKDTLNAAPLLSTAKELKGYNDFISTLKTGIAYYATIEQDIPFDDIEEREEFLSALRDAEEELDHLSLPKTQVLAST